ncbi:MAG: class I SAM-dependent methyltransferase [Acidobacteria bacterium]|nr:MAG: class I SAM-dependent methyltransferase [Acidobacteriota bacterium]
MNQVHRWICSSGHWRKKLEGDVLPWTLDGLDLGQSVLEIGPGYGFTTNWLRRRFERVTVVEIDSRLARSLGRTLHGTNAGVVQGDGTALPFRDASFTGAVAFTMLHHVSPIERQDKLLKEVCRVIRPGSIFAGVDSMGNWVMRLLHIRDILIPIDPTALPARFVAAGFASPTVVTNGRAFRFAVRRHE